MIIKLALIGYDVAGWLFDHFPPCLLDLLFGPMEEFDYTPIEFDGPPGT